jgi:hypothetical protein
MRPISMGTVVHICNNNGDKKLKIRGSWFQPGWEKSEALSQNNQNKKGWRHGSSGKVSVQQV